MHEEGESIIQTNDMTTRPRILGVSGYIYAQSCAPATKAMYFKYVCTYIDMVCEYALEEGPIGATTLETNG